MGASIQILPLGGKRRQNPRWWEEAPKSSIPAVWGVGDLGFYNPGALQEVHDKCNTVDDINPALPIINNIP